MDSRIKVKQLFYIKRTKLRKNGEAPVYLKLSINSQSVEIAIGVTIAPELWSADKGGAKGATSEAKNANSFIEKTSYQINNIISDLKSENMEVTAHSVRNVYLGKTIGNITLISAFEDHNKKIRLLLGKDYAPSTVTEFDSCLRIVKQYLQNRFGKPDVHFDKIDHEFVCGFVLFLKSVRNCEHNTTMKLVKMLKKIIRIALVNNWIKKDPFSSYKISFRKVDRGFLTEAELDLIINTEFEYQ
ncbi:MAG: phage integrase SAM-like domain and Arm DNA-binding domain-containing protein, partial [Bacteroidota bacterium]